MLRVEAPPSVEYEPQPKTAWLFPGQGTQKVGMGLELYAKSPAARRVFDLGLKSLPKDPRSGRSPIEIGFNGPQEELNQTINTQPVVVVYTLACLEFLKEEQPERFRKQPIAVAGYSVGEVSAMCAAESISIEETLFFISQRARAMQEAGEINKGGMISVIGGDDEIKEQLKKRRLEVAIESTPQQIIYGGYLEALAEAEAWLKSNNDIRVDRLEVSGAFHTSLMQPAEKPIREALKLINIKTSSIPIIANTTGNRIQNPEDVEEELTSQITKSLVWYKGISNLEVDQTYEVGIIEEKRSILSNMNRRMLGGAITGIAIAGITAATLWRKYQTPH